MSRAKVVICALVAMFMLGALAAPALAKKETKREFVASGTAKLASHSVGPSTTFNFVFEEKGSIKVTCGLSEGKGEIVPTEGKATTFTDKVKFSGCSEKGPKKTSPPVTIGAAELEFNANGTVTLLNEVKFVLGAKCNMFLGPQTVGAEAVEEGKKGPVVYHQEGEQPTSKLKVEIKTHTHSEGEEGGFEFEQEEGHCGEFKVEGGKLKTSMVVEAVSPKESWIGLHEETIILPKE